MLDELLSIHGFYQLVIVMTITYALNEYMTSSSLSCLIIVLFTTVTIDVFTQLCIIVLLTSTHSVFGCFPTSQWDIVNNYSHLAAVVWRLSVNTQ